MRSVRIYGGLSLDFLKSFSDSGKCSRLSINGGPPEKTIPKLQRIHCAVSSNFDAALRQFLTTLDVL